MVPGVERGTEGVGFATISAMKLAVLAERLGAELTPAAGGDARARRELEEMEITGVAGLEKAGPQEVSFLTNLKYSAAAKTTRAAALLVEPGAPEFPVATLRVANPYLAFARALEMFHAGRRWAAGVHQTAVVSASAKIGRGGTWARMWWWGMTR